MAACIRLGQVTNPLDKYSVSGPYRYLVRMEAAGDKTNVGT